MSLPIIPEFIPPHVHLSETAFFIAATISHADSDTVATASIAETAAEVPTILADVLFDLEELSNEHLKLIASITDTMSTSSVWINNELTGMPHKMHIMIDGDPEVYVQVFTIVKAERVEKEKAA